MKGPPEVVGLRNWRTGEEEEEEEYLSAKEPRKHMRCERAEISGRRANSFRPTISRSQLTAAAASILRSSALKRNSNQGEEPEFRPDCLLGNSILTSAGAGAEGESDYSTIIPASFVPILASNSTRKKPVMQSIPGGGQSLDIETSAAATTRTAEVPRQPNNSKSIGQLAECSSSQVELVQESEGGQAAAAAAAMEALAFDSKVRAEAQLGFQQMRSIEQQLLTTPQGVLGRADVSDAQALRTTIFSASVVIVGSFTKIISLLSANPPPNSISFRNDGFSATNRIGRVESPMSTSHTDSSPPQSPGPRQHSLAAAAANSKEPTTTRTSPVISPVTTPHSGSGMSDNSPTPVLLDSDGDTAAGATAAAAVASRRPANEAAAANSADAECVKRRRKFMSKFTCKQPASLTDPGNDSPPGDGHTWRKYGQKDILGSRNPRSYYRCTHKIELGCPATKYVQRCDEEPSLFNVTYRGNHTCQSIHQQSWPFPCSPEQILAMSQLLPSDSPAAINYRPGLRASPELAAAPHVMASPDEVLLGGGGGRPDYFAQLGLPMAGVVSSASGVLDIPSGPLSYGGSRLAREPLFSENSVFRMLMASPLPLGQNNVRALVAEDLASPSTAGGEQDLPSSSDPKRVKVQHHPMEPTRSSSDNNNSNRLEDDISPQPQYVQGWGAELESCAGFQLQPDGSMRLAYQSSSSTMSDSSPSRELPNDQTASAAERGGGGGSTVAMSELERALVTSLPMGFSIDDMDYEAFPSSSTFYC